ncbi:MAG: ATP-binding cassette domain-containing protein, partial [Lachnospiraceae bacterium]|nr:ATP-binding cassette domain-containing protein [Lachnospiraceae bacterium]
MSKITEDIKKDNYGLEAKLSTSKIEAVNVSKIYKGRKSTTTAMENCNLEVLNNEFVCIVGPSGCGKSTLLRMLAGLDFPTSGEILVNDTPVKGPGADRGMVFQTYTLFPWLTVEENIAFGFKY